MSYEKLPVIIVGTGGASKETYYLVKKINSFQEECFSVLGFIERDSNRIGEHIFDNQTIIASDDSLAELISQYDKVGIIIPLSDAKQKRRLAELLSIYDNIVFPNVIHPSVTFEGDTQIGIGNIISEGVVVACDLELGNFNLVNRCSTTGHDVTVGNYNTINPGTIISGNVTIGNSCLLGAGSVILQGLSIEDEVIIGAGAVLTVNAQQSTTMVGVPARKLDKKEVI